MTSDSLLSTSSASDGMHSEAPKPSCEHRVDTAAGRTCSIYARGPDHGCEACWDDREIGITGNVKLVRFKFCPNNTAYRPARIPAAPRSFDPSRIEICDLVPPDAFSKTFSLNYREVLVFRGENFHSLNVESIIPVEPEECPIVLEEEDSEEVV